MKQLNLKSPLEKSSIKKRRGVAEVISTLLLVVITVVGAVILTGFLDETFVAGSVSVTSSTDTTIKTIKLRAYDTRDGTGLMEYVGLDNRNNATLNFLCRESCNVPNTHPKDGGSDFVVIQIENRAVNSIFLKNIFLDNVNHVWDSDTLGNDLIANSVTSTNGKYPSDGTFSVLKDNANPLKQGTTEIKGGQIANLLIKLDHVNNDIDLSKTMRVQLNIGKNSLSEFLIESGGAQ